jgi:hypothetical protein
MNKTMSEKQLEANRLNAQKSTGPKTEEGKAVSRQNALIHGMRAGQILVDGDRIHESDTEFQDLCREFYEDLAPVGALEKLLTDQIVQATWRLSRAHRAESGEIALSVDGSWWKRQDINPLVSLLRTPQSSNSLPISLKLIRSLAGCEYLIMSLQNLRDSVELECELTEAALKDFKFRMRNGEDTTTEKLDTLRAWLVDNPEKLEPEVLQARHKEAVLKLLDEKVNNAKHWLAINQRKEELEEKARESASVLPSGVVLEKIMRYETVLQRQLYRAITQLERVQQRRAEDGGLRMAEPTKQTAMESKMRNEE